MRSSSAVVDPAQAGITLLLAHPVIQRFRCVSDLSAIDSMVAHYEMYLLAASLTILTAAR